MKGIFKNKKLIFVSSAIVLMIVAAVGAFLLQGKYKDIDTNADEYSFAFYQGEAEILDNHHDIGVMIADCDNADNFLTLQNGKITNRKGRYVQGTGAVVIGDREDSKSGLMLNVASFNEVDISAYADKTIHMSLYINEPKCLTTELVFELTSSGKCDENEIQWEIPATKLEAGWNELYLAVEDASVIGTPDFAKMNYYRIFSIGAKPGLRIAYDCIYATDTAGMSLETVKESVTASTKKGYLLDFDELRGLTSAGKMLSVQAEGEVKEGAGAVAITNPGLIWLQAKLKTFNLTPYQNGKVTFWLYINDSSYIKNNVCIELSSSGTCDKNEISWNIKNTDLKTGWNEVELFVSDAKATSKEPIDLSKINYLRVWSKEPDNKLVVIFDAVRAANRTKHVPDDGMILNCDTEEALRITSDNKVSLTVASDEHKQGTGALKSVGEGVVWYKIVFEDLVDISKYKDGGLHVWFYISDKKKVEAPVTIELSSSGECDVDEYQWKVQSLKNGWNELELKFTDAHVTGTPDLCNINFMRVFCTKVTGEITAIIDDVRAINIEDKIPEPGVILDCDDFNGITVTSQSKLNIGNEDGEYKVGQAAYKSVGSGQVRYEAVLANPVDISAFKDGALQLWLYVGDKSAFTSSTMTIEISSSGKSDNSEIQWNYAIDDLKENAWNQLTLPFEEGKKVDGSTGAIDYKAINHFRLFLNKKETSDDVLLILDDVRAVEIDNTDEPNDPSDPSEPTDPAEPDEPNESGLIMSGDTLKNLKTAVGFEKIITNVKVGTGAFKSEGAALIRYQAILNNAVDISIYKDGALQFWLYVGDTDEIQNESMTIELGSAGEPDKQELQWNYAVSELTKNAWNQVTLKFKDGAPRGDEAIDFTAINHFRIHMTKGKNALLILDDVRAVEVSGPGEILSCDSLWNVNSSSGFTVTTDKKKVGAGAYTSTNITSFIRYRAVLNEAVDISAYKKGALQFWLYIGDVDAFNCSSFAVELGSGASDSAERIRWQDCYFSGLKENDWNLITLKFADITPEKTVGVIDFTQIDFFRLFVNNANGTSEDALMILDDVRAVAEPGVIFNCDDKDQLSYCNGITQQITLDKDNGYQDDATGAYKSQSQAGRFIRYILALNSSVDISAYSDGALQFWLYVGDVKDEDGNLVFGCETYTVELGNGVNSNTGTSSNYIRWSGVSLSKLEENAWNLVTLNFADVTKTEGTFNFTNVDYFRLYVNSTDSNVKASSLMIVDDIRAVETVADTTTDSAGLILSGDDTNNISYSECTQTSTEGEYKVGTGAFKSTGEANVRFRAVLNEAVNISAYEKGALQFWLYIGDVDAFKCSSFAVELSSGASDGAQRIRWQDCYFSGLKENDWNLITLKFADITPEKTVGVIDFTQIDFFRLFVNNANGTSEDALMILDDVRAVHIQ